MSVKTIGATELARLLKDQRHLELIDVRTPVEFQEQHVAGADNVPLEKLNAATFSNRPGPVYFLCQRGGRGKQACEKLARAGIADAVNVEGGTLACAEAGIPTIRGRKAISLERQVRIAAGSLVFIGAVLAWLVNPAFVLLSGFVGAGLIFSGITDTCGMGLLLARMPWNQRREDSSLCTIRAKPAPNR